MCFHTITLRRQKYIKLVIFYKLYLIYSPTKLFFSNPQKGTSVCSVRVMLVSLCTEIFFLKCTQIADHEKFRAASALSYWSKLDESTGYTEPSETRALMLMMCYFSTRKCVVWKPLVKKCSKTAKWGFQGSQNVTVKYCIRLHMS